jgi:hypothetical protein
MNEKEQERSRGKIQMKNEGGYNVAGWPIVGTSN